MIGLDALNLSSGTPPMDRAAAWYRLALIVLMAAFLVQVVPGWMLPGLAPVFVFLSLVTALAAPCLAFWAFHLFRSETSRLSSGAKSVKERRSARALRGNSGPIALICILSAGIILAGLLTVQSMTVLMQGLASITGREPSPQMTPAVSTAYVTIILSRFLWFGVAAGLAVAFLRIRKFRHAVGSFLEAPSSGSGQMGSPAPAPR